MFRSGSTKALYAEFLASYESKRSVPNIQEKPFVYADEGGIRLLTDVVETQKEDGVFAVGVGHDGIVEVLEFN